MKKYESKAVATALISKLLQRKSELEAKNYLDDVSLKELYRLNKAEQTLRNKRAIQAK